MRIVTTAHLRRPIEEVFDFLTTPANWPRWHPSSLSVTGPPTTPWPSAKRSPNSSASPASMGPPSGPAARAASAAPLGHRRRGRERQLGHHHLHLERRKRRHRFRARTALHAPAVGSGRSRGATPPSDRGRICRSAAAAESRPRNVRGRPGVLDLSNPPACGGESPRRGGNIMIRWRWAKGVLALALLVGIAAPALCRTPMVRTEGPRSNGARFDITVPYLTTGRTAFGAYAVVAAHLRLAGCRRPAQPGGPAGVQPALLRGADGLRRLQQRSRSQAVPPAVSGRAERPCHTV